jgi:hypothetical protein
MPPWHKSQDELRTELHEQLQALQSSCNGFDRGGLWEAKRLATIVDTLVHDRNRKTVSLLSQLRVRDAMKFTSSRHEWNNHSVTPQIPLVLIRHTSTGAAYEPVLDKLPFPNAQLSFSKWWEQPILRDIHRRDLSRKNLVCSLRDQDGGGHVDAKLTNEAYASLSRVNGAPFFFGMGDEGSYVGIEVGGKTQTQLSGSLDNSSTDEHKQELAHLRPGPHLASMRQIAWEIEASVSAFRNLNKQQENH